MSVTAMTQAEAVTEVANIIGRDKTSLSADQTTTYETRIKQWLYWSHLTIARLYAFPELDQDPFTSTMSTLTNVYTLSTLGMDNSRMRQILSVTLRNGTQSWKLKQKIFRRFEEDHPNVDADSAGQPRFYTIYGRRLEFWQRPDSAYTVRVRANYLPTDYTSSSAASVYLNKDDVIVAGAVTHAYLSLQENEDAERWSKAFAGRMQAAIGPNMDPQDWEPEGRAFDYNSGRPTMTGDFHANPLVFFNQ